jgi:hypothetical protein
MSHACCRAHTAGLVLATCSAVAAAPPPAAPGVRLDALRWRLIGPFRAGAVLAVAGVPGEHDRFHCGAVNGGVRKSRDAGRTWQPRFDDTGVGSIGALAITPSAPRVLCIGTGDSTLAAGAVLQAEVVARLDARPVAAGRLPLGPGR